jgi:imidazolonepropionase-like amidohydrolase
MPSATAAQLFSRKATAKESEMLLVLQNANVVDGIRGVINPDYQIVIEDSKIVEVGPKSAGHSNADHIDLAGLTVIPGLIDCHCHVMQSTSNLAALSVESPFYAASKAFEIMKGMLHRGFTTVRDVGGADWGIARSVAEGPRVIYGGKALTATGGHGDYRSAGQYYEDPSYWVPRISQLADGLDQVRLAVRDEVRKGAHHIKIMANGGVASPTDKITSDQYPEQEIAAMFGTGVV